MQNRILVLNVEVSGMNKYLFQELRKRGWDLSIIDIPIPKRYRWQALISTFQPNITFWKKRFGEKVERLHKTSHAFLWRTKYYQKKLEQMNIETDIIFQISGMFSPYLSYNGTYKSHIKQNDYVLLLSYTMTLSNKYSQWMPPGLEKEKWFGLERDLYKNARLIFTTNENARKSLLCDYTVESDKVINVGYGLTLDKIPEFSKTYDGKTILFVGIDFKRKGGFILLKAFRRVREAIPDARLIIVGPNKDIYKLDAPGIEVLGYTNDKEELANLYKQASIFVMPSLCEPFGLVFLEAMAYKLPCIGTNIDAMPEIIDDGKTGFLVLPNDADSLKDKIITLLTSPQLLKDMGEASYRRVREEFSWDKVGEKIDSCLRNIL